MNAWLYLLPGRVLLSEPTPFGVPRAGVQALARSAQRCERDATSAPVIGSAPIREGRAVRYAWRPAGRERGLRRLGPAARRPPRIGRREVASGGRISRLCQVLWGIAAPSRSGARCCFRHPQVWQEKRNTKFEYSPKTDVRPLTQNPRWGILDHQKGPISTRGGPF